MVILRHQEEEEEEEFTPLARQQGCTDVPGLYIYMCIYPGPNVFEIYAAKANISEHLQMLYFRQACKRGSKSLLLVIQRQLCLIQTLLS